MNHTAASGSIYFFGTCLADMAFPQAGMAAMRLLKGLGVEVIFPPEQGCCGQPAYNSGFPDEARAVALRQVEIFSRRDIPVVVPSGSCAGMLKHHYPRLFAEHPRYFDVAAFSGRVFEFGDYLANVLKASFTDIGPPVTVTWHSSCHALRETGATAAAKALLGQLTNVTLVELVREHECCGFGGTFAVKRPEVSAAMVLDKVEDIRATGASQVLSSDCGCLLNITGAMERQGMAVQGRHLAEFLWERTHA